ncbi:MAG: HD domain-containing protein [Chloroflexia bacterium]|jgi:poly(A) polymerase|nr:HD domain-containing protein [Chloroflexia bacterium]
MASEAPPSTNLKFSVPDGDVLSCLPAPQQRLVATLARAASDLGGELNLVGGGVRDVLLGERGPADLDFATSLRPDQVRVVGETLPGVTVYDIGEKFGTIGLVIHNPHLHPEDRAGEPDIVEITTFRSESYEAGSRHPAVVFGTSIEADLARRDFTINAIAVNASTGEVIDPWYGQADLATGTLRAVGNPGERFAEDPLRLLRAARFAGQLGFTIEAETLAAMAEQAPMLKQVSGERVFHEVTRLLCSPWADHGLDVLLASGLLTVAMPELLPLEGAALDHPDIHREKDLWDHTKRVIMQTPPRPTVRWAALMHDAAKPVTRTVDNRGEVHFFGHEYVGADMAGALLRRLHADKRTIRDVCRMVELHLRPAGYDRATWTDSAVRRLALDVGDLMPDLLDLVAADVTSARAHKQRAAAARVQGLRDHLARLEGQQALAELQSPLDGNALMALFDRPPGRWIAEVKDHLRELVIDGELAAGDTEAATEIARKLVEESTS